MDRKPGFPVELRNAFALGFFGAMGAKTGLVLLAFFAAKLLACSALK